jgi:hypothetical protein
LAYESGERHIIGHSDDVASSCAFSNANGAHIERMRLGQRTPSINSRIESLWRASGGALSTVACYL